MSFRRRVKFMLVHSLQLSNKRAQELLDEGAVKVNGKVIVSNEIISGHDEIRLKEEIVQIKKETLYIKFHKPKGFESTLSTQVKNNLCSFFAGYTHLAIAGRLDKLSEGLLLLSNNGKWIETICHPGSHKEKEYRVELDKIPDATFFDRFSAGLKIGKQQTAPCQCWSVSAKEIGVILTEGKNRQIRRMCWVLGYTVEKLKRIRIADFTIDDLAEGEYKIMKI